MPMHFHWTLYLEILQSNFTMDHHLLDPIYLVFLGAQKHLFAFWSEGPHCMQCGMWLHALEVFRHRHGLLCINTVVGYLHHLPWITQAKFGLLRVSSERALQVAQSGIQVYILQHLQIICQQERAQAQGQSSSSEKLWMAIAHLLGKGVQPRGFHTQAYIALPQAEL